MEEQKEHKRRVRYKGTHPRNYNEKYKELNPEKYQGTIEHVIQKGSTPAGMHIPILVDEILDFLKIEPGQNGLDATLGYGGHSSRMLACLQGKGHLCALDVDPIEMAKTKERLAAQGYGPEILTILHQNFANIDQVAAKYGPFDFILADLGVSSMQIDNPERGNSDVPFRRRPACEKVHEGTVSDRYLFRIFKRSHSSFQRRMHPQQPCKFNENALGN